MLRRTEVQQQKDIIPDNPHKDGQSVLATARSGAVAVPTENAETDFVSVYLKPHHCSNKRCISCRILEQMCGSTVTRNNDDIESDPFTSVDGLNLKNTRS